MPSGRERPMKSMEAIPNTKSLQKGMTHAAFQIAVPLADLLLDAQVRADDLVGLLRHARLCAGRL